MRGRGSWKSIIKHFLDITFVIKYRLVNRPERFIVLKFSISRAIQNIRDIVVERKRSYTSTFQTYDRILTIQLTKSYKRFLLTVLFAYPHKNYDNAPLDMVTQLVFGLSSKLFSIIWWYSVWSAQFRWITEGLWKFKLPVYFLWNFKLSM